MKKAKTCAGNYLLGSFIIEKENYEQCQVALKEILLLIKYVNQISFCNRNIKVVKYFGGDLKNLATLFGLVMANGTYPCIWCTTSKSNFGCDCQDSTSGDITRSNAESLRSISEKEVSMRKGYIYRPIVDFIDFNYVVVDMLHMYLRISERLLRLFLEFLTYIDDTNSVDLSKRPKFRAFLCTLENKVKITKPYYLAKKNDNSETYKLRSFNCLELDRLFSYLSGPADASSIESEEEDSNEEVAMPPIDCEDEPFEENAENNYGIPSDDDTDDDEASPVNSIPQSEASKMPDSSIDRVISDVISGARSERALFSKRNYKKEFVDNFSKPGQELKTEQFFVVLTEFFRIYSLIKTFNEFSKENMRPIDIGQLRMRLKRWLRIYLKLGFATSITPYIHIFVAHTCNFLHIHFDLNSFNCQGLERLNQQLRQFYHQASNKHSGISSSKGTSALRQVVEKQNRIELMQFYGLE